MRILFLTNFYPPASRGGYELWCQEIAENFRSRGHDVLILTSRSRIEKGNKLDSIWIHRNLHLEVEYVPLKNGIDFFIKRKKKEQENLRLLQEIVQSYKPDIVLIWGMWNIHRSLPALAEQLMPDRVVYYIGDYWPLQSGQYESYWKVPARNWITFFPKLVMKTFALREIACEKQPVIKFDHVIYPTEFMRAQLEQKGLSSKTSQIVYGGIDTSHYYCPGNSKTMLERVGYLSLLYAGRLTEEKGVQTAIEALRVLVDEYGYRKLKLTIVGSGEPEFETHLHNLVRKAKIANYVNFLGNQSKEQMPDIYQQADVLLFTSIWPEPFGRVIVEAMVAGVVVVGTATGGAAEVLMDEVNSLIYEPGNCRQLAEKIIELIKTPGLRERLVENGRRQALEKYDIRQMAGGIEAFLSELQGN